MDEDLDNLREKSTRASSVYDDLGEGGATQTSGRGFSPRQRLILAFLLFIDIIALAFAALVISGQLSL